MESLLKKAIQKMNVCLGITWNSSETETMGNISNIDISINWKFLSYSVISITTSMISLHEEKKPLSKTLLRQALISCKPYLSIFCFNETCFNVRVIRCKRMRGKKNKKLRRRVFSCCFYLPPASSSYLFYPLFFFLW